MSTSQNAEKQKQTKEVKSKEDSRLNKLTVRLNDNELKRLDWLCKYADKKRSQVMRDFLEI